MNKLMKFISVFLTSIVLIVSAIPSVSAVYASEQVSQIETNMELQPVTSLTEEQINTLANEIQSFHPDVSQQWIKEVINRQLQGDYTIPPTYSPFRAAWQGITVNQMGALKERKGMILYQIIPFLLSVNPSECVWRFDTKCQSCINVTISKKVTENSCFVGLLWVSNRHVDSPYLLMAKRI